MVRANLGQKGRGQATPLVGTQFASKSAEPLELFKEGVKLSHNTPHHAPRKEIRSCKTTKIAQVKTLSCVIIGLNL